MGGESTGDGEGPAASVRRLARQLADAGWTERDFEKNHLRYTYHQVVNPSPEAREEYVSYWRTVADIHRALEARGISAVFLQARRHFPYYSSNVNTLVTRAESAAVIDALSSTSWRLPSKWIQRKQLMIERNKLKLPSTVPELVPAHLYFAVTWRYQTDVGLLGGEADPSALTEWVDLGELCPDIEDVQGVRVLMPTFAADLLIHSAEAAFENYRVALSAALYLEHLWESVSEPEIDSVLALARTKRAGPAVELVRKEVERAMAREVIPQAAHWPFHLPVPGLMHTWAARLSGRGLAPVGWLRGVEELTGYALFFTLYTGKRRVAIPLLNRIRGK